MLGRLAVAEGGQLVAVLAEEPGDGSRVGVGIGLVAKPIEPPMPDTKMVIGWLELPQVKAMQVAARKRPCV